MFGVVLWSSKEERKAVIWCEDHGDLAFFSGKGDSALDGPSLDAGDLVAFNLSEGRDMRVATDPRLVAEQHYADLAENLIAAGAPQAINPLSHSPVKSRADADNVVSLAQRRRTTRSIAS